MNKYFIKRGKKTIIVEFDDEKLNIEVLIPTNREHNELMEKYTNFDNHGIANVRISEMAEAQMLKYIIDLPFEVPVNIEMNIFKQWIDCNNDEKKIAINCINPKLHDVISNSIIASNGLSEDESGN